jgi:hypothetical protein
MNPATAGAGQLSLLELCMGERDRAVLAFASSGATSATSSSVSSGSHQPATSNCCWPCSSGPKPPPPTPSSSQACGRCGTGDGADSWTAIRGCDRPADHVPYDAPLREIKSDGSNGTRSSAPRLTWDVRDRGSACETSR